MLFLYDGVAKRKKGENTHGAARSAQRAKNLYDPLRKAPGAGAVERLVFRGGRRVRRSRSSDELLRLFEDINRQGQTILMVTHSVKAASHAGRVLFIKDAENPAAEPAVLLPPRPVHRRFGHDLPDEAERRQPGQHLHFVHHGHRHAVVHRGPVRRAGGRAPLALSAGHHRDGRFCHRRTSPGAGKPGGRNGAAGRLCRAECDPPALPDRNRPAGRAGVSP